MPDARVTPEGAAVGVGVGWPAWAIRVGPAVALEAGVVPPRVKGT